MSLEVIECLKQPPCNLMIGMENGFQKVHQTFWRTFAAGARKADAVPPPILGYGEIRPWLHGALLFGFRTISDKRDNNTRYANAPRNRFWGVPMRFVSLCGNLTLSKALKMKSPLFLEGLGISFPFLVGFLDFGFHLLPFAIYEV
jgi:hypothetical protein